MSRTNDRMRYKYGICLNDECEKCKSKEVQQIPMRKELVCEACGKELRECPPPKKGNKTPLIVGGAIVAVAAALGICYVALSGGSKQDVAPVDTTAVDSAAKKVITVVKTDTIKQVDTVTVEKVVEKKVPVPVEKGTPPRNSKYGTVNLGYGKYTGDLKNGKPHGHGTITYTSTHKILSSKDYVAHSGDTFEGDFRDGKVSGNIGYWKHDGGEMTPIKP